MYGWYTQQSTTRILRALNEFQRYHTTTPSANDIYLHRIIQHHNNVHEVFNLGTALRPFHRHLRWVSKKHLSKRAEYSPNLQDLRSEGPLHQNEGYYVIIVYEGIGGIVGEIKIVQDIPQPVIWTLWCKTIQQSTRMGDTWMIPQINGTIERNIGINLGDWRTITYCCRYHLSLEMRNNNIHWFSVYLREEWWCYCCCWICLIDIWHMSW